MSTVGSDDEARLREAASPVLPASSPDRSPLLSPYHPSRLKGLHPMDLDVASDGTRSPDPNQSPRYFGAGDALHSSPEMSSSRPRGISDASYDDHVEKLAGKFEDAQTMVRGNKKGPKGGGGKAQKTRSVSRGWSKQWLPQGQPSGGKRGSGDGGEGGTPQSHGGREKGRKKKGNKAGAGAPGGVGTKQQRSMSWRNNKESISESLRRELNRAIQRRVGAMNLSCRHLSGVPGELSKLTLLKTLDLSYNQIDALPPLCCPGLNVLNLASNAFETVPSFGEALGITDLDLSCNQIGSLSTSFEALKSLHTLRLNGNRLEEIKPSEMSCLSPVVELYLHDNQLKTSPEFAMLKRLRVITMHHNKVGAVEPGTLATCQDLEELSFEGNSLTDITFIVSTSLTSLKLSDNQIRAFPQSAAVLSKLKTIDFHSNKISAIPSYIGTLTNITSMNLSRNNLDSLPDQLAGMSGLMSLNLSHNNFGTLSWCLSKLDKLESLDISHNQIVCLPPSLGDLNHLDVLRVDHNPIRVPHPAVCSRGSAAILENLRQLKRGARPWYRTKLMFVGRGGSGKTSLCRALRYGPRGFDPVVQSTDGIDINPEEFEVDLTQESLAKWNLPPSTKEKIPDDGGQNLVFSTWDFAGQAVYFSTHNFFLSKRAIYLVAWDSTRMMDDPSSDVDFWVNAISARAPRAPIIIVGTHIDLVTSSELRPEDSLTLNRIMQSSKAVVGCVMVSSKTGASVQRLKEKLVETALESPTLGLGLDVPLNYYALYQEIKGYKDKLLAAAEPAAGADSWENKMSQGPVGLEWFCEMFGSKCNLNTTDDMKEGIRLLHDLGVLLYFEETSDNLENFVFLYPQWLADVLRCIVTAKVIPGEELLIRDGVLSHSRLCEIFNFDVEKQLLQLLYQFELCYPISDSTSLVPSRLPVEQPASLEWTPERAFRTVARYFTFDMPESQGMIRWYEALFARFLVRLRDFQMRNLWLTGAVVEYDSEHSALIELFPHVRRLTIIVAGVEPANLMMILCDTLQALLLEHYRGIRLVDGSESISETMGLSSHLSRNASDLSLVRRTSQSSITDMKFGRAGSINFIAENPTITMEITVPCYKCRDTFRSNGDENIRVFSRHVCVNAMGMRRSIRCGLGHQVCGRKIMSGSHNVGRDNRDTCCDDHHEIGRQENIDDSEELFRTRDIQRSQAKNREFLKKFLYRKQLAKGTTPRVFVVLPRVSCNPRIHKIILEFISLMNLGNMSTIRVLKEYVHDRLSQKEQHMATPFFLYEALRSCKCLMGAVSFLSVDSAVQESSHGGDSEDSASYAGAAQKGLNRKLGDDVARHLQSFAWDHETSVFKRVGSLPFHRRSSSGLTPDFGASTDSLKSAADEMNAAPLFNSEASNAALWNNSTFELHVLCECPGAWHLVPGAVVPVVDPRESIPILCRYASSNDLLRYLADSSLEPILISNFNDLLVRMENDTTISAVPIAVRQMRSDIATDVVEAESVLGELIPKALLQDTLTRQNLAGGEVCWTCQKHTAKAEQRERILKEGSYGSADLVFFFSSPLVLADRNNRILQRDNLLNFSEEKANLLSAFEEANVNIDVRFEVATWNKLSQIILNGQCNCLHYSGHGDPDSLYFEDEWGSAHLIQSSLLSKLLASPSGTAKLNFVFVSACYSERTAQAFVDAGVRHVVACKVTERLADWAAITFTRTLYKLLVQGSTVQHAFDTARESVKQSSGPGGASLEADKFILLPRDANHNIALFTDLVPVRKWNFKPSHPVTALPAVPEHFLGRCREMYELFGLIRQNRFVTIHGPQGIGKTALIQSLGDYILPRLTGPADEFSDGLLWVDLSSWDRLERTIHVPFTDMIRHEFHEMVSTLDDCIQFLRSKSALLLIDISQTIGLRERRQLWTILCDMMTFCRNVKTIVSTREPLSTVVVPRGITEHRFEVGGIGPIWASKLLNMSAKLSPDEVSAVTMIDVEVFEPETIASASAGISAPAIPITSFYYPSDRVVMTDSIETTKGSKRRILTFKKTDGDEAEKDKGANEHYELRNPFPWVGSGRVTIESAWEGVASERRPPIPTSASVNDLASYDALYGTGNAANFNTATSASGVLESHHATGATPKTDENTGPLTIDTSTYHSKHLKQYDFTFDFSGQFSFPESNTCMRCGNATKVSHRYGGDNILECPSCNKAYYRCKPKYKLQTPLVDDDQDGMIVWMLDHGPFNTNCVKGHHYELESVTLRQNSDALLKRHPFVGLMCGHPTSIKLAASILGSDTGPNRLGRLYNTMRMHLQPGFDYVLLQKLASDSVNGEYPEYQNNILDNNNQGPPTMPGPLNGGMFGEPPELGLLTPNITTASAVVDYVRMLIQTNRELVEKVNILEERLTEAERGTEDQAQLHRRLDALEDLVHSSLNPGRRVSGGSVDLPVPTRSPRGVRIADNPTAQSPQRPPKPLT